MKSYQDLLAIGDDERKLKDFVKVVIEEHKSTELFRNAVIADEYDKHRNTTIMNFQKLLYTLTGEAVPDNWSANYKLASNFFHRFVIQENQYLLGNGCTWSESGTPEALGEDFDARLQEIGHDALVQGEAFGFFDYDRLRVFKVTEFAPLYDDEDGALKAGVRWWQVAPEKPLRATLYDLNGIIEFEWTKDDREGKVLKWRSPYKKVAIGDNVDFQNGTELYEGENYPSFPIVPLWANQAHQSELVGMREQIDCFDLIKSGFADTVDEASFLYWAIQNGGGMNDMDLAKFVERMKTMHAAVVEDDGARAEAHTVEAPVNARSELLARLEADMYRDYMAFDTQAIASGAITATQIKAAYEPINNKVDQYEYQIKLFLKDILSVAGVDDEPTFTRSKVVNVQEEIATLLSAAQYLPQDYVTEKVLTLLGDADKVEDILEQMDEEEQERFVNGAGNEEPEESPEENPEEV